jgi:dipeptidyl aminopeptidase/acylaminoacyl peptidase
MPRKINIEDFQKIALVSDPQFSPDYKTVAFLKRHIDADKSKYRSEIWLAPADGGPARRFTGGDWSDSTPRWSPDGKTIAFLSDRQKPKSQIFLIPTDGGEARALTSLEVEGGIGSICWSPDGTHIAFTFRATPAMWRKDASEERSKKELPPPPRHHKRLFYRLDGFGYFDDEYPQVWVANVATSEAKQLTSGDYGCSSITWSPDSKTIAFTSDRRPDFDITTAQEDIWLVSIEGGDLRRVPSPKGDKGALTWSPDGKLFAYTGNPDPEDQWGTSNDRLFVMPAEGSDTAADLTGASDMSVGYLTLSDVHDAGAGDLLKWNADGTALFFPVSVNGDTRLAFVPATGGEVRVVSAVNQEMGGFSLSPDGRAAVTIGTPTTPHALYLLQAGSEGVTQTLLYDPNTEWLSEVTIVTPEPQEIANDSGGHVPAWIIKPPDLDPAKKYPLVVYVHGGPHAQYGNVLFHELQWLAAEGYVVLYTNPRGSKGYGEAHTKAIRGSWGDADFRDVMSATDYAVALPYVDASRTAIMGGSYGGYMTAWAIGHTDRFTCAIADRLVANLHSMSGTVDFPWQHQTYFPGNAWSDPADLWRMSPLAYAGNIVTPLLLIHSEGDLRCDIGQAEEIFAALRHQRKTVEFVRYPAESSHGLSRNGPPTLRLHRLQRNVEWLNRFLKG